jgi:NAD(P)-dependent dehydrogenase (short-subunit alcohol dehydrogenase family)
MTAVAKSRRVSSSYDLPAIVDSDRRAPAVVGGKPDDDSMEPKSLARSPDTPTEISWTSGAKTNPMDEVEIPTQKPSGSEIRKTEPLPAPPKQSTSFTAPLTRSSAVRKRTNDLSDRVGPITAVFAPEELSEAAEEESRVTAEFYNCAIEVMRGAEAIDEYTALPLQEAFDIEYWLLEEAKLRRQPPEKELARQVAVVIGAGSGIGKEVAHRLVNEAAHIVCVDVKLDAAIATAKEITDKYGPGIGVAGTGISNCGLAIGLACDITNRASVRSMLDQVALAYGGFDSIVVTAGIFFSPDTTGHIPDDKWALTFAINVTGSYIVADEASKTWKEQGLPGSLVLTTSANAVVAKKGSVAYDTSKAAANHLVGELAVELAPLIRVNGVAPATVVQGSAMFPRERVIASLSKYGIVYSASESSHALTERLAKFYAERTLTKNPITPADQAEGFFLLVSNRLAKTTGHIIPVDGGLSDAFLR